MVAMSRPLPCEFAGNICAADMYMRGKRIVRAYMRGTRSYAPEVGIKFVDMLNMGVLFEHYASHGAAIMIREYRNRVK
jgi:hypothetical protein